MYKAIKGYEGFYEINEFGQIRSVDRTIYYKDGRVRKFHGKKMKLMTDKDGYFIINLNKNGVSKTWRVHRLVADTFLPNPDNFNQIHHINHNIQDNDLQNLMWVNELGQRDEHWRTTQSKIRGTRLHVVGNGIDKIYNSSREVERELGIPNTNAMRVAKGIYKQSKGYNIYFADASVARNA